MGDRKHTRWRENTLPSSDTTTPAWELVIKDTAQQLLNTSGINRDIENLDYFYFGSTIA